MPLLPAWGVMPVPPFEAPLALIGVLITTLAAYPSVGLHFAPRPHSGPAISGDLLGMNLAMRYNDIANVSSIMKGFNSASIAAARWPSGVGLPAQQQRSQPYPPNTPPRPVALI